MTPRPQAASRPLTVGIALLLGACAALAFIPHALRPSLWRDEAVTAGYVRLSWGRIWGYAAERDASSTFYYLIAKATSLHGEHLRYLSVAAMTLATMVIAAVLARRVGAIAAVFAGVLLVGSPLMLRYAQEARSTALAVLFATAATAFFLSAWQSKRGGWWVGYAVALTGLGLLQFTALALVIGHGVLAIALRRKGMPWRRWLVSLVAVGVAVSPLLWFLAQQRGQLTFVRRPDLRGVLSPFELLVGGRIPLVVVSVLLLCGLVVGRPTERARLLTVLGLGLLPLAALVGVSFAVPLYTDRYAMFALPCVAAAIAVAVHTVAERRRWLGAVAAVAVLAVSAWGVHTGMPLRGPAGHGEDLRTPSSLVARGAQPGDAAVFASGMWRLARYAYPQDYRGVADVAIGETGVTDTWFPAALSGSNLSEALACHPRAWVLREVRAPGVALDPEAQQTLDVLADWPSQPVWQRGSIALDLRTNPAVNPDCGP